jgi:hypothetical protein
VTFLLREESFQLQLRKTGFSYEIFKKHKEKEKGEDITRLDLAFNYGSNTPTIEFTWQGENEIGEVLNFYSHLGRFENLRKVKRVTGVSADNNIKLVFEAGENGRVKYDIWVKPAVAEKLRLQGQEDAALKIGEGNRNVEFHFYGDTVRENIPMIFPN